MIKSLLLKDFYTIKKLKTLKTSLIMVLIFTIVFGFTLGKETSSIMVVIMFLSFSFSLYQQDEKAKTLEYLKSLPIKEKDIVKEKFILNGILVLISFLIINIFFGILYILGQNIVLEDIMQSLISILAIYSVYSIYIPLIYKYSSRKAPIMILVFFVVVLVICGLLLNISTGESFVKPISEARIIMTLLIFILLINVISYISAVKILKNKDL